MSRKQMALLEPTLVRQALIDSITKLSPHVQWRNPVMFIVWIGSVLTTLLAMAMACGISTAAPGLPAYWSVAVVYRTVRQPRRSAGGRSQ
jgi:K+-transporting ATPase ATPase B chain